MRLTISCELLALSLLATIPYVTALSLGNTEARNFLSARDPLGLFARDDGCSSVGLSSDYTSCGGGLPNNFCCNTKAGDRCQAFNNNKSVICCPAGTDCTAFFQIGCRVQGLNVTAPGNANSSIHSTVIDNGLLTCSTGNCCPQGYLCSSDDDGKALCVQDKNSTSASTSTSSSTAAAASLSGAPTTAPTTTSPSSNSDSTPSEDNKCAAFPPVAILVGFFPGMIIGILVTIVTIVCLGRGARKTRETNSDPKYANGPGHAPLGGINRQISEPTMQDSGATRVDFLRRMSRSKGSPAPSSNTAVSTPMRNSARVRSLFSSTGRTKQGNYATMEDVPEVPVTPAHRIKREPSTETINVFSPPNLQFEGPLSQVGRDQRENRATRWDDVMQGGGLNVTRGLAAPPAFLGSPGMVDPRKRPLDGGTKLR